MSKNQLDIEINLIKGKSYSLIYFLIVIVIFVSTTLVLLYLLKLSSSNIDRLKPIVDDSVEIVDLKFTIEELGNYTIQGKVLNHIDKPRRCIVLRFNLLDENNKVIDSIKYEISTNKDLHKGVPEPFIIIGENIRDYLKTNKKIKLSYYVESFI